MTSPSTPQPFHVRRATTADSSVVASIYNETIEARDATMVLDTVSSADMTAHMQELSERESLWVLEELGQIQGWGVVKFYSERPGYARACETSVFLRRSETGRGLGSAIQPVLLKAAKEAGFHHVLVRIWAANASSIAMHEKFGFTIVGTQQEVGYVDGAWVDVTVMQCLLD